MLLLPRKETGDHRAATDPPAHNDLRLTAHKKREAPPKPDAQSNLPKQSPGSFARWLRIPSIWNVITL